MPGIGIIANPHSKLNKRSPQELNALQEISGQKGILTITKDLDHLDQTLVRYRKANIDILAINGGDGTISQVITRMLAIYGSQKLPILAILRGGTMNLIASQLGLSGSPRSILQKVMQQDLENCRTEELSTLRVKNVFGFLYADHSSTAILEEFYRKKSGHLGATWLALRITHSFLKKSQLFQGLVKAHELEAHFTPAATFRQPVLGCFAGTISKFPLNIPFLPLATRYPGRFQTMAVTCDADKLLWYLPLLMMQHTEGVSLGKASYCCEQAVLQYQEEVHYTIDGEIYTEPSGRITIEAGPSLSFLSI